MKKFGILFLIVIMVIPFLPTWLFVYGMILARADLDLGEYGWGTLSYTRVLKLNALSARGYDFFFEQFTDKYDDMWTARLMMMERSLVLETEYDTNMDIVARRKELVEKLPARHMHPLKWKYGLDAQGNAHISHVKPCVGKIVVPAMIDGHRVVEIGEFVFGRNPFIDEIVISEGVKGFNVTPFSGSKINRIVFPASFTGMDKGTFYNSKVKQIVVHPGNPKFEAVDGALRIKGSGEVVYQFESGDSRRDGV